MSDHATAEQIEAYILQCARRAAQNDGTLDGASTKEALTDIVDKEVYRLGLQSDHEWQWSLTETKKMLAYGLLRYAEGVAAGMAIARESEV